jgi:hypothetical protein
MRNCHFRRFRRFSKQIFAGPAFQAKPRINRHYLFVIPSELEESRGVTLKRASRDPSTSLRFARDDIACARVGS